MLWRRILQWELIHVIRIVTKDGLVDSDGYLLDDEGNRIKKYNPFKLDIRDYNMVQTYYWFYDLHGRLKQENKPPGDYHGKPRAYVQEDVEENKDDNTVTSHLRYYLGKKLISYYTPTIFALNPRFISGYEDADTRYKISQSVRFLLDGGWELYKVETRKQKKSLLKVKRKLTPIKKSKKVIKRPVIKKKRK
jgi:hypothetical protein